MLNSGYVKAKAVEYGADLVGIGDIKLYEGCDLREDPRQILPTAKCVIGVAFRVPRGVYRTMAEKTQYYNYTSLGVKFLAEERTTIFLLKFARILENAGYEACIQRTCPNIQLRHDYGTNPEVQGSFPLDKSIPVSSDKPEPDVLINFDKSAVLCGVASLGYRGNALTRQFGPFQRFAFIITNAPLETDKILDESLCDSCGECVKACPGKAISHETQIYSIADKEYHIGTYDKWQCSVYYRGAHKSNPFIREDFLKENPEREIILNGDKRFSPEEAKAIYSKLDFLPPTHYGYVPCLCSKKCDMACYSHLKKKGLLTKKNQKEFQINKKKGELKCNFKDRIVEFAKKSGADLVGFSSINRFSDSNKWHNPLNIFSDTKTIIGLGFRVLRGSFRGIEEGSTYYQYTSMGVELLEETYMPETMMRLCAMIEDEGYEAIPQKNFQLIMADKGDTNPEMNYKKIYRGIDQTQIDFKEAAVACGLGEIGSSGTVLTDDFGPFQRFCFILTDAVIEPSELYTPHLCDNCGKCKVACHGNAFQKSAVTKSFGGVRHRFFPIDNWQCATYYKGANGMKNPFMPFNALDDLDDRKLIIQGEKHLGQCEAQNVMDELIFYPPAKHSYTISICGRACDRACYIHLEEKGVLKRKFDKSFRDKDDWKLSLLKDAY